MYSLTLHPEKTKIVYCKNYQRKEEYKENSFSFLSYTFRPIPALDNFGRKKLIVLFNGAISNAAQANIREKIRKVINPQWTNTSIEQFAEVLNPKIRGWINYYSKFFRKGVLRVLPTWI